MKLTEKQRRVVDYYVETGNATEAARRAGYKNPNKASAQNMVKDGICAAVSSRLKELEDKRIAKADEVMQFLTSTLRGEVKEERVVVEGTGEGRSDARIIKVQVSARDRLEAAKLKRYPMLLDAKEQKLRLQKLEAEIRAAEQVDDDAVTIVDDLGDGDDENDTAQ